MTTPSESTSDPESSVFYDQLLDYLLVALLAVEGLVIAWLGVIVATIDRTFAEEFAAEAVANGDQPFGLSEPALVDAVHGIATWAGGGLVATGVLLVVAGAWFYRYRGRVRQRVAADLRPPRWHATLLGAVLATALAFVPFAQAGGGAVAGYLTDRSSLLAGALVGVLFGAPAYVFWGAVAVGAVVAGVPTVAVLVLVVALVTVVADVVVAAIGGLLGGFLA
ncbi:MULTISPECIES: DUF5518 domain-containing protein [Halobacterium]|uniref:DUF5518 domain-containing protein n=1 Tax=Halobacterium TaxID=2239 RepID=UPI00073EC6DE|nr:MULTISPECIES: DUF5518 domain-containing protein [Halobacterium]MCG1004516.1 DUF5518 domain-containing protein [Halobacterium noricense]